MCERVRRLQANSGFRANSGGFTCPGPWLGALLSQRPAHPADKDVDSVSVFERRSWCAPSLSLITPAAAMQLTVLVFAVALCTG